MNYSMISIILYSSIILYGGYFSSAGPSSRKAFLKQCDMPTLKNGVVRLRQKGRLIKFQCYKPYTLIGNIYAGCVGGKWDTQFPICAKSGCKTMESRENGFILSQRRGLMASLFCEEHYKVAGAQMAYCDGSNWDRPIGSCRPTTENSKWCDFEVDDLCGWTHDNTHDFQWKRVIGADALKRHRTGPQHDHTTMQSNAGHYMLVESINQLPDDRARLISPVFQKNLTINTCFRFYYHMYGATVGTLRVYVKPVSIGIDKMLKELGFTYFEISGNHGNVWHEEIFNLNQVDDDFQIIFEGTAGNGHLSDIAIDDIALLDADQCPHSETDHTEEEYTSTERGLIIFDVQSCKNRCDEKSPVNETMIKSQQGLIITCNCHPECEMTQTCCSDFRSSCIFGSNYSEGDEYDIEYTTQEFMTTTENLPDSTEMMTEQISITTVQFLQEDTSKFLKDDEITTISEVSHETDMVKISKNFSTHTTPESSETISKILLTPSYIGDVASDLTTTENAWDVFENTTWNMYEIIPSSNEWQIKASFAKNRQGIPTWLVIILGICVTVGILSLLSFVILYYRKHFGPENYKKNAENSTNNCNEEFSEVRYLTCDEHLDFTLQTPATTNNLAKI